MWLHGVFHDAVALVTRSNSRSGFTTRNLAELSAPFLTAMMLVRRYFSDNLNFYPKDTHAQASLCWGFMPFEVSTGGSVDIIGNIPKGKCFPESVFQSNHADTTDTVPDQGWNHRSKHKSDRKCEPGEHLNEISITEMKIYSTGSPKMPEIRYQQPDGTLLYKHKRANGTMNTISFQIRVLLTGLAMLVLTGCIVPGGGGSGGGGVSAFGTGTASLSWLPPTQNTDGSSISNLAGYKIYYGTEIGNYTDVINIDNPGVANYVIENLLAGYTYYFVLTAYDADGNESSYSGVGSKTITA